MAQRIALLSELPVVEVLDFLVPDVAFLRYERLRAMPVVDREQPPVAPDVAIDVRSTSDRAGFRKRKIAKYLACGSSLVLDVNTKTRTIVGQSRDGVRTFHEGDRFESPAAPWLTFDVGEAFAGLEYLTQ
jgi:Uma2 family endonuclease